MSYLNSVTIIGFVRADLEQRQARNNNGSKFTVFSADFSAFTPALIA